MRTVIERFLQKQEKKNLVAKVQKSQILMSFLTLFVCVGVLCTGSWAYFTDSATGFVAEIHEAPKTNSQLLELELQTIVAYTLDEPELIEETEQSDEPKENGADSEETTGEPQEITEELTGNIFTAPQDGKYQFTMVFSGNTAGYGKIIVAAGKETAGTEKIYVTEAVTPSETDSVEYSVIIQLATGCTVSFEACLGEVPEDTEGEIVKHEAEILFSDLENTEEQPTEESPKEPSEEETIEDTEEDPVVEPTEGKPAPETGQPSPEAGNPVSEDEEVAPQTQMAEEETEVQEGL